MSKPAFIQPALETMEGAGAEVKRLFPIPRLRNHDPFVLWDHFSVAPGTGFPDHPHRGFEAITYMFAGSMEHTDNLGNQSTVEAGGAQRFTAGRGLVHSEMPGTTGKNDGIQLWINLPKRLKQIEPAYQQVDSNEFPLERFAGGWKKTLVGEGSPLQLLTPVLYLEIQLDPGGEYQQAIPETFRGLIYLAEGEMAINGETVKTAAACFFDKGGEIALKSVKGGRAMLVFGQPHGEPIIQYGPFVD